MEIEQLMARARHRAHYTQARERRRIEKQQGLQTQRGRRPAKAEATILKFAAAPAARVSAQGTQVLLPDSVLDIIMASLASCLEPGGVYGPSLVARDLANASLVCTEFYCAAQFGFSALNSNIQQTLQQQLHRQPLPPPPSPYLGVKVRQAHNTAAALSSGMNLPGPKGWHFWELLVTEPLAITISELEAAARQMGIVDVSPARPAAAAAMGAAPGAAAHLDAAAAAASPVEVGRGIAAAAERAAAGAATAMKGSTSSSNKHRARLIGKLLACFCLTQPLPVTAAAGAGAPAGAQAPVVSDDANITQCLAIAPHTSTAASAADNSTTASSASHPAVAAAAAPPACTSCSSTASRAALLRALTLERCCPIIAGDGPDKCAGLLAAVRELSELGYKPAAHAQAYNGLRGCLAKVRAELTAAGVQSREVLMQLLQQQRDAAASKRQQRQQQQQQQQQQRRRQQQRGVPGKRPAGAVAAAAMGAAAAKRAKGFSLSSVSIRPAEKDHAFCD